MICQKCGREIPNDANFCPGCGAEKTKELQIPEVKKKKIGLGGILFLAIFVLVIVGYFRNDIDKMFSKSNKPSTSTQSEMKDDKTPQQHIEMALNMKGSTAIRGQLFFIPDGTPGKDKVLAHLKTIETEEHEKWEKQNEAAQKERQKKIEENKKILLKFRKDTDRVNQITFYRDPNSPRYVNSRSEMYLYFSEKNGEPIDLHLKIQYVADDWLFIENFIIKTDTDTFDIQPTSENEIKRDNGEGNIWEWFDIRVTSLEQKIIYSIIKSRSTILRYSGRQYYHDRAITNNERQRLLNVLDAFLAIGGKISE